MKLNTIAWIITGAGAYLRECVDVAEYIKNSLNIKITLLLTRWGYEVARIFGVLPRLKRIASGGYYEEFLVDDEGMYYVGRVNMKRYSIVIIAPATANTIAKIVNGVADTVATSFFAQAEKSGIPIIVLPTDVPNEEGFIVSETPCYIDRSICIARNCLQCIPYTLCPVKAIDIVEGVPRINLAKCIGCELCVKACPYGGVRCWEKIQLRPRDIDLENIARLSRKEGVYIVKKPWEIVEKVEKLIER